MSSMDHTLVDRALSGEQQAFQELVIRHKDCMYAVAVGKIGNFIDAEDIVQNAFVESYKDLGKLQEPAKYRNWLWGITVNLARKWHRHSSGIQTVSIDDIGDKDGSGIPVSELPSGMADTPESRYEAKELHKIVEDAIRALDEKYREVVVLHYMEGMSYAEIAEHMELPESTVLGRLQVARQNLREELIGYVENDLKKRRLNEGFVQNVMDRLPSVPESVPSSSPASGGNRIGWLSGSALAAAFCGALLISGLSDFGFNTDTEGGGVPQNIGLMGTAVIDDNRPDWVRTTLFPQDDTFQPDLSNNASSEETAPSLESPPKPQDSEPPQLPPNVYEYRYTLSDSATVDAAVLDMIGEIALFEQGLKPGGEHRLTLDLSFLPAGIYIVWVTLRPDDPRERYVDFYESGRPLGSFYHKPSREDSLARQKTIQTLNSRYARQNIQKVIPIRTHILRDRKQLYYDAIQPFAAHGDSAQLHDAIDSLTVLRPLADTYHYIAETLMNEHRALPTALAFAEQAVDSLDQVFLFRDRHSVAYLHTLGRLYSILGRDARAEQTLLRALDHFHRLSTSNQLSYAVDLHLSLGGFYEKQMADTTSLRYYREGLRYDLADARLRSAHRQTYIRINGSDEGYETIEADLQASGIIDSQIPSRQTARITIESPPDQEEPDLEDVARTNDYYLWKSNPDPFETSTEIAYHLLMYEDVKLSIYDAEGNRVRVLVHEKQKAGYYVVKWDGRQTNGMAAGPGIYYYRLSTEHFSRTRRMEKIR